MTCTICKRPLNNPNDPTSLDCGGDCLRCMAVVAEDPDCMKSYIEALSAENERLREEVQDLMDELAYHGIYPRPIIGDTE